MPPLSGHCFVVAPGAATVCSCPYFRFPPGRPADLTTYGLPPEDAICRCLHPFRDHFLPDELAVPPGIAPVSQLAPVGPPGHPGSPGAPGDPTDPSQPLPGVPSWLAASQARTPRRDAGMRLSLLERSSPTPGSPHATQAALPPHLLTALTMQTGARAANLKRSESAARNFPKIAKPAKRLKAGARDDTLPRDVRFCVIIRIWGAFSTTPKQQNLLYRVARDQFISSSRRYGLVADLTVPAVTPLLEFARLLEPILAPFHFPPPSPPNLHTHSTYPTLSWLPAKGKGAGDKLMLIALEQKPHMTAFELWKDCGGRPNHSDPDLHIVPRNGHLGKLLRGTVMSGSFGLIRAMTRDRITPQDLMEISGDSSSSNELPSLDELLRGVEPAEHSPVRPPSPAPPVPPSCSAGRPPTSLAPLHLPSSSSLRPVHAGASQHAGAPAGSGILQSLDDLFHSSQPGPGMVHPAVRSSRLLGSNPPVPAPVFRLPSAEFTSPKELIGHMRAASGIEQWGPSPTVHGDDTEGAAVQLEAWLRAAVTPLVRLDSSPLHQLAHLRNLLTLRHWITVGAKSRGRGTTMDVLCCLTLRLIARGVFVPVGLSDYVTLRVRDFSSAAPLAPLSSGAKLDCALAGAVCLAFLCLLEQAPPMLSPPFLERVLAGGPVSLPTLRRFEPRIHQAVALWKALSHGGSCLPPEQSLEKNHPQYALATYIYEHLDIQVMFDFLPPRKWHRWLIGQASLPLPLDAPEPEEVLFFRKGLDLPLHSGPSLLTLLPRRYQGGVPAFVKAACARERLEQPIQLLARLQWHFHRTASQTVQEQVKLRLEAFLSGAGVTPQLDQALQSGRFVWPPDTGPADALHPLFRTRHFLRTATGSDALPKPPATSAEGKITIRFDTEAQGLRFSTCTRVVVFPVISHPDNPLLMGDYGTGLDFDTFLFTEITAPRGHTTL
ncbi:hypothetical protein CALVIDRAFT_561606 [Calocera viscosa TUFC12733]|uniref:Uncharacterized protein n=1 Tax=Calocera viscosa (strain TUFC12733) TaxID=1330018 RepID=A0A167PX90_CALVF|nr:hypothetical protein CALVIDRAFT_561606 [Calocera viscosa TUFC12733]